MLPRKVEGKDWMRPVFIGGTGRSGTTVLKKVLSRHSGVAAFPFELRIIVDPGGILDLHHNLAENWSPYSADTAIHRFIHLAKACSKSSWAGKIFAHGLIKLGISPWRYYQVGVSQVVGTSHYQGSLSTLLKRLVRHASDGSWAGSDPFQLRSKIYEAGPFKPDDLACILADFIHTLYAHPGNRQKTHWVEDTPYNLLHADRLLTIFPNLKLLHIYRDPRDVVASYHNFRWGGDSFPVIAQRLAGIYQRWFEIRKRLPDSTYLELGLEDLAREPQAQLERVCQFLGLEFESGLLGVALDQVHAGRWKRDIPGSQLDAVKNHLGDYILALGYAA